MKLDLNQAVRIQELIQNGPIFNVLKYAQMSFPNECCGFILENGAVFPAHNVIETLCNHSLTSKNAFLIDTESWKLVSANPNRIVCIYHSHTNGTPNMSAMDRQSLRWPDLCYLIIGLIDTNPVSSKIFWWEDKDLHELDIKL